MIITKMCLKCKKEFESKSSAKRKYCSIKCFHITKMLNLTKICIECNKPFRINSTLRFKEAKFCSYKCYWIDKTRHIGSDSPRWNGGTYKTKQGYIMIYKSKHPFCDCRKYVKRANLVMEKMIGRFIKPEEVVHHINGIKNDDRPENLKLFSTGNEHNSFHSKIKFPKGSLFGINKKLITCPTSPPAV